MIKLTEQEKELILLCKGHLYGNRKGFMLRWYSTHYRYNYPYYKRREALKVIFDNLFELYMKIQEDKSGSYLELKSIILAGVEQVWTFESPRPLQRIINKLISYIRLNKVEGRYKLL